jgi:hypothetical protein
MTSIWDRRHRRPGRVVPASTYGAGTPWRASQTAVRARETANPQVITHAGPRALSLAEPIGQRSLSPARLPASTSFPCISWYRSRDTLVSRRCSSSRRTCCSAACAMALLLRFAAPHCAGGGRRAPGMNGPPEDAGISGGPGQGRQTRVSPGSRDANASALWIFESRVLCTPVSDP